MMTGHRRAFGSALGPVAAHHVGKRRARKGRAVGPRAGQHVVLVGRLRAAVHGLTFFVQCRRFRQVIVGRVQLFDAPGDHDALGVLPRAGADSVARIHELRIVQCGRLRAQLGAPRAITGTRRLRKRLAVLVRALEAAQVGSLARPSAGHKNDMSLALGDGMLAQPTNIIKLAAASNVLRIMLRITFSR